MVSSRTIICIFHMGICDMGSYVWWKYRIILAFWCSVFLSLFASCMGDLVKYIPCSAFFFGWLLYLVGTISGIKDSNTLMMFCIPCLLIGTTINSFIAIVTFELARTHLRKSKKRYHGCWEDRDPHDDHSNQV